MNNRIGEKNINNFGSEMIITGYRNNLIRGKFKDKKETNTYK